MEVHAAEPRDAPIPRPALLLGWLGVVPFAAFGLATVAGSDPTAVLARQALAIYASAILAFMGGVQWGLAITAEAQDPAILLRRLAISTLPALSASAMAALPARAGLIGLAAGFVALLAYDIVTARAGITPGWYPALRIQLTAAVLLCLLVAAGFGRA